MFVRLTSLAIVLTAVMGCEQALRSADLKPGDEQDRPLPPTLARLQRAYPDLHSGRFVCLADFNAQAQAELFRVVGAAGNPAGSQPSISVLRCINETGAGGLTARLSSRNDQLLFDGVRSEKLALVRDWRDYHLLLLNICGPPDGLRLEFHIQSGGATPIRWTRTLFARPGWNLYRFDLDEIGAAIDLADVRALGWRAPELSEPVDLYLDDLIITDNTRWLLGQDAAEGELYVFTRGRRTHVGTPGRFELAFCDGVIVAWYAGDQHNLTVWSGLGPWPVPLPADWASRRGDPVVYDDPALFAEWGARVIAGQRLVEQSAFRVVIEGIWRFVSARDAGDSAVEASPAHHWRYVIYPSGQVYVCVTSEPRAAGWTSPRVGYAIALNGRSGFTRVAPATAYGPGPAANFVLMSQAGRERPDLLWSPQSPELAAQQLELVSADERRIAVTVGDVEPGDTLETAHLLRFWPWDIEAAPEAQSFAGDYQQPATLEVPRGRQTSDQPGDLNGDGFNESEGCYELEAEDGLLRFKLLPGLCLRHQPIFRVRGTADRDCWVYADGRIVNRQGRDQSGELLFTMQCALSTPLTVEVVTRPRSTP